MHLKQLAGEALLTQTRSLVSEERRITIELIEHLREIERRMLFAEMGYGSLFEFCVRHLGLSEGSAQRRISAMRLVRDVPEAKAAIETGAVSLTNASKLHSVFQSSRRMKQELPREQKLQLLEEVSGLTQRECDSRLFEVVPDAMKQLTREKERLVSPDATEVKLILSSELHEKLIRLKQLLSHRIPTGSTLETLEYLIQKELVALEKKRGLTEDAPSETSSTDQDKATTEPSTATPVQNETTESDISAATSSSRAYIPMHLQRHVWRRARGKCEFPGCTSRFQLEVDHVVTLAQGGTNDLENLRLLCRTHNQFEARAQLGSATMKRYLPRTR